MHYFALTHGQASNFILHHKWVILYSRLWASYLGSSSEVFFIARGLVTRSEKRIWQSADLILHYSYESSVWLILTYPKLLGYAPWSQLTVILKGLHRLVGSPPRQIVLDSAQHRRAALLVITRTHHFFRLLRGLPQSVAQLSSQPCQQNLITLRDSSTIIASWQHHCSSENDLLLSHQELVTMVAEFRELFP